MTNCTTLRARWFHAKATIPGLDGLRAVSIALVLLGHLSGTQGFPLSLRRIPLGVFGVRIFFVISGFLITSILLRELREAGEISLDRFYFRRILRLFPASYFLIAVMGFLGSRRVIQLAPWDLSFGVTYTMNYYDGRGWPLGHLWSLAVEEQFYLLWPFALKAMGPRRATRVLLGVLAAAPLLRLVSPHVGPALNFAVWSDALGTGCLLALLRRCLAGNARYSSMLRSRWFALIPAIAFLAGLVPSTKLQFLFCGTIMNVAIAITIDWAISAAGGPVARFLNCTPVTFVGLLSYSLYLWQQPFLNRSSAAVWCSFPLNLLLAAVAALGSFLLIESPFLRMRESLERAAFEPARVRAAVTRTA